MLAINLTISIIFASGRINPEIHEILDAFSELKIIFETCNPEDFIDLQHVTSDLVLVELNGEIGVPEWLGQLAQRLPQSAVLICSQRWRPDFVIQAAQIGVREFLTLPFTRTDLESAIERVYQTKKPNLPEDYKRGHVIVVTGYRGGIGATTIAINLAMALGEQTANKVALIDLGRPFPDIANFLDQEVTFSLSDLINQERIDISFLQKIMQPYESKIDILNGCADFKDQYSLETKVVDHIFNLLRHMYKYIVVDLGHEINEMFINVINETDMVLMLSGLTVADLKNMNIIWPLLGEWVGGHAKIKIVVNRLNKGNSVQLQRLEEIIKSPPFETLPSDYHLLMDALIHGKPLGISAPRSRLWRKIRNLAEKVQQQMEIGSEEAEYKISAASSQRRVWLLPGGYRLNRLGAMFMTISSVGMAALVFLVIYSGLLRQNPVLHAVNVSEKVISAPSSLTAKAEEPTPKVIAGEPTPTVKAQEPAPEVVSSSPVAASSPEAEVKAKYVGSITSNKYHHPDCKWAKTILPERLIGFKSVAEAKEKGYMPCPTCKPSRED